MIFTIGFVSLVLAAVLQRHKRLSDVLVAVGALLMLLSVMTLAWNHLP